MIAGSLATKVRLIQIRTRRSVNSLLAGQYHSVFKGRGMEFDEVREYTPGDEVRDIDWNVTARTGRLFVKRYCEERELTLMFAVDVSRSTAFGSGARRKSEIAAEVCALLAFSAVRNHDKLGLLLFSEQPELFVPPRKGVTNALRLVREVLEFPPRRRGTDVSAALDCLGRMLHRSCVLFLVSDFCATGFESSLRLIARRHDTIAVRIVDPREEVLPDAGLVALRDPETGESVLLDSGRPEVRAAYAEAARRRSAALAALFQSAGVDQVRISTEADHVAALAGFFRTRERRL